MGNRGVASPQEPTNGKETKDKHPSPKSANPADDESKSNENTLDPEARSPQDKHLELPYFKASMGNSSIDSFAIRQIETPYFPNSKIEELTDFFLHDENFKAMKGNGRIKQYLITAGLWGFPDAIKKIISHLRNKVTHHQKEREFRSC